MRKLLIAALLLTFAGCSQGSGKSEALVGQAADRATNGDLRGAIAILDQAVQIDPANALAFAVRGTAYRKLGDYRRAIEDCTKAIQLDPRSDAAFYQRAFAYQQSNLAGRNKHSFADANEAIKLNQGAALPYILRGNALLERREYEEAIADFNKAIELNPKSCAGYGGRARVYQALGEIAKARADVRKALSCNPTAEDKTQLLALRDALGNRP